MMSGRNRKENEQDDRERDRREGKLGRQAPCDCPEACACGRHRTVIETDYFPTTRQLNLSQYGNKDKGTHTLKLSPKFVRRPAMRTEVNQGRNESYDESVFNLSQMHSFIENQRPVSQRQETISIKSSLVSPDLTEEEINHFEDTIVDEQRTKIAISDEQKDVYGGFCQPVEIDKGCVRLTVSVQGKEKLKELLQMYQDGRLKKELEEMFFTEKIKEMAQNRKLELKVELDVKAIEQKLLLWEAEGDEASRHDCVLACNINDNISGGNSGRLSPISFTYCKKQDSWYWCKGERGTNTPLNQNWIPVSETQYQGLTPADKYLNTIIYLQANKINPPSIDDDKCPVCIHNSKAYDSKDTISPLSCEFLPISASSDQTDDVDIIHLIRKSPDSGFASIDSLPDSKEEVNEFDSVWFSPEDKLSCGRSSSTLSRIGDVSLSVAEQEANMTIRKIAQTPVRLNIQDQDNRDKKMDLMRAVIQGRKDYVKTLVEHGCRIDINDRKGYNALLFAIELGRSEIADILVDKSSTSCTKVYDKNGDTPLILAIKQKCGISFITKLSRISEVNIKSRTGKTAMQVALSLSNTKVASELIRHPNIELNAIVHKGGTVLHYAAYVNETEIAKYIVYETNCNLDAESTDGSTALHIAYNQPDKVVFRILVEGGANVNKLFPDGKSILLRTILDKDVELLKYLINETHCDLTTGSREKLLDIEIQQGNKEMVNIMAIAECAPQGKYKSPTMNKTDSGPFASPKLMQTFFPCKEEGDETNSVCTQISIDDWYPMPPLTLGKALIINNFHFQNEVYDRRGSDLDVAKLYKEFTELNLDVVTFEDMTGDELLNCLKDYQQLDHSDYGCFICCILSHGSYNTVYGVDGVHIPIRDVTSLFVESHCRTLSGKPKAFIIVSCQDVPETTEMLVDDRRLDDYIPKFSKDFIIAYSTLPRFSSYRYPDSGTPFVDALAENLRKYGRYRDFLAILRNSNKILNKETFDLGDAFVSMPTYLQSSLCHEFVLRPRRSIASTNISEYLQSDIPYGRYDQIVYHIILILSLFFILAAPSSKQKLVDIE